MSKKRKRGIALIVIGAILLLGSLIGLFFVSKGLLQIIGNVGLFIMVVGLYINWLERERTVEFWRWYLLRNYRRQYIRGLIYLYSSLYVFLCGFYNWTMAHFVAAVAHIEHGIFHAFGWAVVALVGMLLLMFTF